MIDIISIVMIASGLLFFFAAVIGILRFPDFYTRMHAAGKGDTLSTVLVVGGIALHYANTHNWSFDAFLVVLKLIAIVVFIFIVSPTSTHVLMKAGYDSGHRPFSKSKTSEPKENKKS